MNTNPKRILIFLLSLAYGTLADAQAWVGIGLGGHLNDVSFFNSSGVKDERIQGILSTYFSFYLAHDLGQRRGPDISRNTLFFQAGYKKGVSRNKESSVLEKWTIDNLSTSLTFRRMIQSRRLVNPYLGAGLGVDLITGAAQQEGFEQYDLTDDLKRVNVSAIAEAGLTYFISHDIYGTLGASYLHGLTNLEKNPAQTAHVHGWKVGIDIFFQLK